MASETVPPGWLSVKEVASEYGMSRQWVYQNKDKIGYTKMSPGRGGRVRLARSDVERFMASGYHEARDQPAPIVRRRSRRNRVIITHID